MWIETAYYEGLHRDSYRRGEFAEILRAVWVKPVGSQEYDWRLCFEIRYEDGEIDYAPVDDAGAYRIVGCVKPALVWRRDL